MVLHRRFELAAIAGDPCVSARLISKSVQAPIPACGLGGDVAGNCALPCARVAFHEGGTKPPATLPSPFL